MMEGVDGLVTGYVLAGGLSSRMGQDKALLQIDGEPLVARAVRKLQPVCEQVWILSGPPSSERDALLSCYAHLVPDEDSAHAGPLAALTAALNHSITRYALLLAVDQPGISTESLAGLAQSGTRYQASAACFSVKGAPEPLPLLVSRDLRPEIFRALHAGERRLLQTVQAGAAKLGRDLHLVPLPQPLELLNLNTPEDLRLFQSGAVSNHSALRASEIHDG